MSDGPVFLYVEDHVASRRIMQILLVEVMGYSQLTMLEDTQDIMEKLESSQQFFDVIFLDVNLKPHDGLAVCAMLRGHDRFCDAKIIGLTANSTSADMRRLQEAGFDGAIGKPISYDTFPEQVERILAGEAMWEAM